MGIYLEGRSGRWVARSKMVKGKRTYIGAYKTEAEAENALAIYNLAREKRSQLKRLHELPVDYAHPKDHGISLGFFAKLFRRKRV